MSDSLSWNLTVCPVLRLVLHFWFHNCGYCCASKLARTYPIAQSYLSSCAVVCSEFCASGLARERFTIVSWVLHYFSGLQFCCLRSLCLVCLEIRQYVLKSDSLFLDLCYGQMCQRCWTNGQAVHNVTCCSGNSMIWWSNFHICTWFGTRLQQHWKQNKVLKTEQSIEVRTLISWVSLGGHRCLMTSYQIKFIGTLGFTCQDVDTGMMLIIKNFKT